jgi:hypothetical protein
MEATFDEMLSSCSNTLHLPSTKVSRGYDNRIELEARKKEAPWLKPKIKSLKSQILVNRIAFHASKAMVVVSTSSRRLVYLPVMKWSEPIYVQGDEGLELQIYRRPPSN